LFVRCCLMLPIVASCYLYGCLYYFVFPNAIDQMVKVVFDFWCLKPQTYICDSRGSLWDHFLWIINQMASPFTFAWIQQFYHNQMVRYYCLRYMFLEDWGEDKMKIYQSRSIIYLMLILWWRRTQLWQLSTLSYIFFWFLF
jgi:hypothetical protein